MGRVKKVAEHPLEFRGLVGSDFAMTDPSLENAKWTSGWHMSSELMQNVGVLAVEWTRLEYASFILFCRLSALPLNKAEAVFYTLRSNQPRRDIIAALGAISLSDEQKLHLNQLLSEFKTLASDYRNKFSHHLWMGIAEDLQSATIYDPRQRTRPEKAPESMPVSIAELRELQHRVIDLAQEMTFFPVPLGGVVPPPPSLPKSDA